MCLTAVGQMCQTAGAATLLHRYSFSGDATDSVGGADGALLTNGTISGDTLTTTGTAGTTSGVSLPTTAIAGITTDFSIEQYATWAGGTLNFSTLFAFSTNNTTYLLASPRRGGTGNLAGVAYNPVGGTTGAFTGETVLTAPTLTAGALTQFVTTYESATNTISLYINGALASTATTSGAFDLSAVGSGFRGINGNNQFDASMNGSTDDFRIYSGALTAEQVVALGAAGADATNVDVMAAAVIPEPASLVIAGLGAVMLAGRRKR